MNERAHCPYLGLRQNRAIRFAAPTSEHRCYVTGEAQDIPVDQRTHCLSVNHRACPLYTGEWSATTAGVVAASGAVALPPRSVRERLGNRDSIFYLVVIGLIMTITAVWAGIGYLYTTGNTSGAPTLGSINTPATAIETATSTATLAPTKDTPPAATQWVTAVIMRQGVALEWQRPAATDLKGYKIFRSDREDQDFVQLTNDMQNGLRLTETYTDRSAPFGRKLYYRVVAIDQADNESLPFTIRVQMPEEPPATPIAVPTATVEPTATAAPPTATTVPTLPPTRVPTQQPIWVPPPAPIPPTPIPPTPVPPTETPAPPTETPLPPTETPVPPSETPVPPTETATPFITETPVPTDVPPEPTPQPSDSSAPTPEATPVSTIEIVEPSAPPVEQTSTP